MSASRERNYELLREEDMGSPSKYRKLLLRLVRFAAGNLVGYDLKHEDENVSILALDQEGRVILAEQYRGGPQKRLIEMPGGGVNKGDHRWTAKQELFEETGYAVRDEDLEYVGSMYVCGYSTGMRRVYVARNCVKIEDPPGQGIERGDLEVKLMTLPQFLEHLRSGQLSDVEAGYRALDHIGYLRPAS